MLSGMSMPSRRHDHTPGSALRRVGRGRGSDVAWATKALDEVRRGLAAQLRRTGRADQAATIKKTRWALLKTHPTSPGSSAPH